MKHEITQPIVSAAGSSNPFGTSKESPEQAESTNNPFGEPVEDEEYDNQLNPFGE